MILGGRGETLTIRHDTSSREAFVPGVELALEKVPASRRASPSGSKLCSERPRRGGVEVAGLVLELLRPRAPEELLDEEAFANDEFLPYWAELWPSALALAAVLPERLDGLAWSSSAAGSGFPRWSPPRAEPA